MATATVSSGYCGSLNCLLCFNQFVNPRVLPCLHSFCEKCLGDYIASNVKHSSAKIVCPVCYGEFDPPNRKIPIDKWAASFIMNDMIVSIIKLREETNESSNMCGLCKCEGEEVKAEFWCPECRDKLCAKCLRYHSRIAVSKNHKAVPIEEMKAKENLKLNYDPNCGCDRGNVVDVLCMDHKQIICTLCATTTHRNCKEVKDLEKTGNELIQGNMTSNVMRDVDKMMNNLQKYNDNIKNNKSKLLSDIDKSVSIMDDTCKEMKELIETFQLTFRKTANQLRENLVSKHEANAITIHRFSTNADNSSQIFKAFNHYGNPKQTLIAYSKVISQLDSHYSRLKRELEGEQDVRVKFEVDKVFQELKKRATSLCEISTSSTPSVSARNFMEDMNGILKTMTTRTRVNPAVCAAQIAKVDPLKCSLTHVTSVSRWEVKGGTDRPWFTGGTSLTNGHLIMADINNNRLVEFDTRYKMAAEYKLDGQPRDVASLGQFVYVSVFRNYGIHIYQCNVFGGLSVMGQMETPDNEIWGLSLMNDGSIVAGSKNEVHILSHSGKPLHKIMKTGGNPCYVAVSRQSPAMLYYRDNDNTGPNVSLALKDGIPLLQYRYRHVDLKQPTGMCLGDMGVLYVCCCYTGKVHQISPDGKRGRIVLDRLRKISVPQALLYNPHTKEYVFTSGNQDTLMEVYTLN